MIEKNFYILPPVAVGSSEVQNGPPDAENQVFAAGDQPYALGARVWDAGKAYTSLADNNNAALSDGGSWQDDGNVDEGALKWVAGTYAEGIYKVHNAFLWQSASDANNEEPSDTSEKWTKIGVTNRFKAFDGFLQDAAIGIGSLSWQMVVPDLVTQVAVFRAVGSDVTITMTDGVEGEVYNQTFELLDDSNVDDWWDYFFADVVQADAILAEDLPPYAGAEITVTIAGAGGGNVSVGQIVIGRGLAVGLVKTGTSVGIESYSIKDRDDFNRSLVVARPYSDTVDFDIAIPTREVGFVKRRLAERDALPTVYYMADGTAFGAVAYGFFQNFDILHSTSAIADCVLEIEGLG